jgi:Ser/Thr protein kinase RdoA (MazF antagonist)
MRRLAPSPVNGPPPEAHFRSFPVDYAAEILRRYPPDCRPTAIEPLGSAGGLSGARFWRVVAPRGALALRCWPIEHPTPDGLRFIHAVLRHAADRGLTILPVPIALPNGDTLVRHAGHLWDLAPWLTGVADFEKSPRVEKLRGAMTALARFHEAVADFPCPASTMADGGAPAVTGRLARLRELHSGGIEQLARAISTDSWPKIAPVARQFVADLPRIVPPAIEGLAPLADARLPLQVCIRDIWHDHLLFEGDVVTGLIDFGAVQVDTPTTDVARLLGSLASVLPILNAEQQEQQLWREGLAAYTRVRPLSSTQLQSVGALDWAGTILAGCNWIRWLYVEGRRFHNDEQVVRRFRQITGRCSRILKSSGV